MRSACYSNSTAAAAAVEKMQLDGAPDGLLEQCPVPAAEASIQTRLLLSINVR